MRLAECRSANDQNLGRLAQGNVKETDIIVTMVTVVIACIEVSPHSRTRSPT